MTENTRSQLIAHNSQKLNNESQLIICICMGKGEARNEGSNSEAVGQGRGWGGGVTTHGAADEMRVEENGNRFVQVEHI